MLRDQHFRLVTLGRLTIVGPHGEEDESLARRRRKLAVLSVLALARRPLSRDTLLGLFWAEHDEPRARHSLSNALSSLRRVLGERAITTRDSEVALAPDAPLEVDALEFAEAVERGAMARAIELYAGPFLEGIYVDESPAFDQWVTRERRRLEQAFARACADHCGTLARSRRWTECAAVAQRWLDAEPLSADAALFLLNAIKAPGTRAALAQGLEEFDGMRERLRRDFNLGPHPSVVELAARMRDQLAAAPPEAPTPVRPTGDQGAGRAPEAPLPSPAEPAAPVPPAGQGRPAGSSAATVRRRLTIPIAAPLILLAVLAAVQWRWREVSTTGRPVVAVLSLPGRGLDSTSAWLVEGLPQMIDGKLARVAGIDVVPAEQVRAVIRRRGLAMDAPIADGNARDLARRVGATLVAHGSLARDGNSLVLDLAIHDVRSGALVKNAVLANGDPLALADEAAAGILGAANVSSGGPRLTDVETTSVEAWQQYMHALDAGQAGRAGEWQRAIDASIALDSGFIPALRARLGGATNDSALANQLRSAIARHASRASVFDRLEQDVWDAYYGGERERSEALARGLARRYPRDPRAFQLLGSILSSHGEMDDAAEVVAAGLALDSLAIGAGTGPCAQCAGFLNVVNLHWARGDWREAEAWARRWITQQPDAPAAWASLAWTLSYAQKPDAALPMMERAVTLSGGEVWAMEQYARMLLVARRPAAADSAIASLAARHGETAAVEVADLRSLLLREHGRVHDADRVIEQLVRQSPSAGSFGELILADNRRLAGDGPAAARRFEALAHGLALHSLPVPPGSARAWCWHHALAADALGMVADSVTLAAMADTLERGCTRSFYGRDWRLYHHVRGIIAMRANRFADAEHEFTQAVWSRAEGWSRTWVELARARSALGRPRDAIDALRFAYATRLDAMGRYVPISQLDAFMARLFDAAGEPDSAARYAGYATRALVNADPGILASVGRR